jgi:signal transduction histidine kinase
LHNNYVPRQKGTLLESESARAKRNAGYDFARSLLTPLIVSIAYYLGARAAFAIGTLSDRIFAPFWPPNVVLFCTLILVARRRWWVYILATFPAHVLAELSVGMPAVQLLVAFATNCMVATLSAYGVQRFLKEPPWFGSLRNASIYILIATAISPAISALGGAFVQILGGGSIHNYSGYWLNWYLANALGSIAIGPAVMIWSEKHAWVLPRTRRWIEAGILILGLAGVCSIVFHSNGGTVESGFLPAVLYSPIPFIVWAAIRFGQRGASGAILVLTVVSIWQNLHASSVFVGGDPERNVLALQIFLMGIAIPVFFLGALIDELATTGRAMRELAAMLLRAQDDERRRIARELHDSTGQNLVVGDLLLDRIQKTDPQTSQPLFEDLHKILRQSMIEIRTLSYLLHPTLLDRMGLDIALRAYLDGFSRRTGIQVDLQLPADSTALPRAVELVLFRVIQESLSNVWRHSGSQTARVQLAHEPSPEGRRMTLSIEDFGKGIPSHIRESTLSGHCHNLPVGLGLVGMRERLQQIGGKLEIDSTMGSTVIRAIVNVAAAS